MLISELVLHNLLTWKQFSTHFKNDLKLMKFWVVFLKAMFHYRRAVGVHWILHFSIISFVNLHIYNAPIGSARQTAPVTSLCRVSTLLYSWKEWFNLFRRLIWVTVFILSYRLRPCCIFVFRNFPRNKHCLEERDKSVLYSIQDWRIKLPSPTFYKRMCYLRLGFGTIFVIWTLFRLA